MKRIQIILCSLLCVSLVGCSKSTEPTLAEESLTLEYGENPFEEAKLEDLLENYDSIKSEYQYSLSLLSNEDEKIDADSITEEQPLAVGKYNLIIHYADDKEPLVLPVTIKDTKAPEFKDFKDNISIDYEYEKDLSSLFDATDLTEVKISIDGAVNVKKAGDYKVKVIAEDANGNKTEKSCTITVKSKPKEESTTTSNSNSSSNGASNSSNVYSGSINKKPASNSGQSSSNSSSNAGSSNNNSGGSSIGTSGSNQQSCVVPNNQIGNSGMVFATEQEAYEWGATYQLEHCDTICSFGYGAMYDTCNNIVGYTVGFNYCKS